MKSSDIIGAALLLVGFAACGGTVRVEGGEGGEGNRTPTAPWRGGGSSGGGAPNIGGGGSSPSARAGAPAAGGAGSAGDAGAGGASDCTVGGKTYPNGAQWQCDCNTCGCEGGSLWSTAAFCVACKYGGNLYAKGQKFPAIDGCNTCTCDDNQGVVCTEAICQCDPAHEPNLHYMATSSASCQLADYACPNATTPFGNECGCGCQQPDSCPEYINCQPGAAGCADQKYDCPFSKIAQ